MVKVYFEFEVHVDTSKSGETPRVFQIWKVRYVTEMELAERPRKGEGWIFKHDGVDIIPDIVRVDDVNVHHDRVKGISVTAWMVPTGFAETAGKFASDISHILGWTAELLTTETQ